MMRKKEKNKKGEKAPKKNYDFYPPRQFESRQFECPELVSGCIEN